MAANESGFYDVMISHEWSEDMESKAKKLAEMLRLMGLKVFFKQAFVSREQVVRAVRNSSVFVAMLSENYISKVKGELTKKSTDKMDFCRTEFILANLYHGPETCMPILMSQKVKDRGRWGKVMKQLFRDSVWVSYTDETKLDRVTSEISEFVKHIQVSGTPKKALFSTLSDIQFEQNLDLIRQKGSEYVEGTRLWLLEGVSRELNLEDKQIYAIVGSAGMGKSVMSSLICLAGDLFEPEFVFQKLLVESNGKARNRHLSKSKSFHLGLPKAAASFLVTAAFALKHDESFAKDPKNAILSIVRQMLISVPGYLEEVAPILQGFDSASKDLKEIYINLIAQPMRSMNENGRSPKVPAAIVIDGLDECKEDMKVPLFQLILDWKELMPGWLRLIVTSRQEDLLPLGSKQHLITILETDSELNVKDLRIYFRTQLLRMKAGMKGIEEAVAILTKRSGGVFIYARFFDLMLKELGSEISLEKIKEMDAFPDGLAAFYLTYFQRFLDVTLGGSQERFVRLFSSMCVAREPLPVSVVREILDFEDEELFEEFLLNSEHLLVNSSGTLRALHKSMLDFLSNSEQNVRKHLRVNETVGNEWLANFCFENCTSCAFAGRNLAFHACLIGKYDRMAALLSDFESLFGILVAQKCPARQFVRDLEEGFRKAATDAYENAFLVIQALEKSCPGLDRDPRELHGQMIGRLKDTHPLIQGAKSLHTSYRYIFPYSKGNKGMIKADAPVRKVLLGHSDLLNDVAMRGEMLVTASRDDTAKIWSRVTGEALHTLIGHTSAVLCVDLNDEMIITGSEDETIKIWSIETGEEVLTLTGHTDIVQSVVLDGDTIISGSWDMTVRVWEIGTGKEIRVIKGFGRGVWGVASDGDVVVSAHELGNVNVWEKASGALIRMLEGHTGIAYSVAIHDDTIVSCSDDETVLVWSKSSGLLVHTIRENQCVLCVDVDDHMIVSGSIDKTFKLWNKNTGELIRTVEGHSHWVKGVAMDGETIATASSDGTARIWTKAKITTMVEFETHSAPVNSIAVDKEVIVTGSGGLDINGVQDRKIGWARNEDKSVRVWSVESGELLHTFRGHELPVLQVILDGDIITSRGVEYELVDCTDELVAEYRFIHGRKLRLTDKVIAEETLHWSISTKQQLDTAPKKALAEVASTPCNFTNSKFVLQSADSSIVGLTMDGEVECVTVLPNNPNVAIVVDSSQHAPIRLHVSS